MSTADDDLALVRRAQSGDESAFAALLEHHAKPLLNFVWRMLGDRAGAEDVAQEVFVRAWRRLGSYRENGAAFSTWLFQIARNAAVDHLRARVRRPSEPLDALAEQPAFAGPGPDALAQRAELADAIARAVARLPEDQRAAFVLAEFHGLAARAIAAVLSCSEKAVERRLYRARHFLRAELGGWA